MTSLAPRVRTRHPDVGRVALLPSMTALATIVALALPPSAHASAGPAEVAPVEAPAPASDAVSETADPAVELSRAHFRRGLTAYEAGDYGEAVTHWTQAHALMATEPELTAARHVLELDLGQAHVRAFEADGDRAHLTAARPLLEGYVAWLDRPGHALTTAERDDRTRATSLLARVDIEGTAAIPAPAPTPAAVVHTPARSSRADTPALDRRQANRMMIGGGVVLGIGVAAAIGAVALMPRARRLESEYESVVDAAGGGFFDDATQAQLREIERRGAAVNRGSIGLAAVAVAGLVVGVPLLAVGGAARRRNARLGATASAHDVGVSFAMRF